MNTTQNTAFPNKNPRAVLLLALKLTLGGIGYGLLEIAYRGFTHYSMIIAGGICFCILVSLSKSKKNLLLLCVGGGIAITAVEFIFGAVFNLWLGMEVWDYSKEKLNLLGQICVRFTVQWCALSAVVLSIARLVRSTVPKITKKLGVLRTAAKKTT